MAGQSCNYCDDRATHEITDEANYDSQETVPSCNECCGGCIGNSECGYDDNEIGAQSDDAAADRALSGTIDRSQIVATPQHGRFTGEFSYRVNHIDHPYHAGRTYMGYTQDEAIDAHKAHLESNGN